MGFLSSEPAAKKSLDLDNALQQADFFIDRMDVTEFD
jgi:hypothetical protein